MTRMARISHHAGIRGDEKAVTDDFITNEIGP
jgi:hypothetical protein